MATGSRTEFAQGDGRMKKKEDECRKNISPSETLVVNSNEDITRHQDLQTLFEPLKELARIDMKCNYAFVQFKAISQATNGSKLDQSVLTAECVVHQRGDSSSRDRDRRGDRGHDRYDNRRAGPPRPPASHAGTAAPLRSPLPRRPSLVRRLSPFVVIAVHSGDVPVVVVV